tara:strand:+ start:328 stop:474 length:147 start_codon:yes stop_codon:yes gene_type:complete
VVVEVVNPLDQALEEMVELIKGNQELLTLVVEVVVMMVQEGTQEVLVL